ncbi:MAG: hypothetical protein HY909_26565 [Deltaproteobacteria bacterium]|nr:hypothetical protein [Deltaproteobacteria bacterium]
MAHTYGFGSVTEAGFTGFRKALDEGAWASVELGALDREEPSLLGAPGEVTLAAGWKLRLRWSLGALNAALAGQDAANVEDAAWDRLQRRLDAQLSVHESEEDPALVSAAQRLRRRLLRGDGTLQTSYRYEDEVRFGRMQVAEASDGECAQDVALCGLGSTLQLIGEATERLAEKIGYGVQEAKPRPRSVLVREAWAGCVVAFDAVYGELRWYLAHARSEAHKATGEALLAPLQRLLAEHRGRDEGVPRRAGNP